MMLKLATLLFCSYLVLQASFFNVSMAQDGTYDYVDKCDYGYDYDDYGVCYPVTGSGPISAPSPDDSSSYQPYPPSPDDSPAYNQAGGMARVPSSPDSPPFAEPTVPNTIYELVSPSAPVQSSPVTPPATITTPSTAAASSGSILLLEASVNPSICKDINFYYDCAQSYSVKVSGSTMTLTPSSSAPSSCGIGTGDISGSSAQGSFPDGTKFSGSATTSAGQQVINVDVPIYFQNITSCRGNYIVTSGEVLGIKPMSGGLLPPSGPRVGSKSGSTMHFLHPVAALIFGGIVAALFY